MYIEAPQFEPVKNPIFLAGPIQGTWEWQSKAEEIINQLDNSIDIASPRRKFFNKDFNYDEQVDWESKYLKQSSEEGCIIFWLANETNHMCDRAYAQTTRFEIAEWYIKSPNALSVGMDTNFPGGRYIRKRLEIPIYDSLEEVCKNAIKIVNERKNT